MENFIFCAASILGRINNALNEKANVTQWQSNAITIQTFKSVPNKKLSAFVNFDVKIFYLSISEKLLTNAIS